MVKGSNASGARLLVETLVSESAAAR